MSDRKDLAVHVCGLISLADLMAVAPDVDACLSCRTI